MAGFREFSPSLLAIVLSHAHMDHYGLARYLPAGTKMIMGAATERILTAAVPFTRSGTTLANVSHMESAIPLSSGPFTITPFLVDHSAYDAYALLVEADGQRLFYSGDLRATGRKGALFERLLHQPPLAVDALLMEGTTIGRTGVDATFKTEYDVEQGLLEHIRNTRGLTLVCASGQNIDRLVSIFKATRRAGRQLVIDMYTAEILRATGNRKLPQAECSGVRVFLPAVQRAQIIRSKRFDIAHRYRGRRIYRDQLANAALNSVMLFRPSMINDLEAADCLKEARLVYSMWPGYLKRAESLQLVAWLERHRIPLSTCHTSGHATPADLQRMAKAIAPKVLVPIHTSAPSSFADLFEGVQMKREGEWWEVAHG